MDDLEEFTLADFAFMLLAGLIVFAAGGAAAYLALPLSGIASGAVVARAFGATVVFRIQSGPVGLGIEPLAAAEGLYEPVYRPYLFGPVYREGTDVIRGTLGRTHTWLTAGASEALHRDRTDKRAGPVAGLPPSLLGAIVETFLRSRNPYWIVFLVLPLVAALAGIMAGVVVSGVAIIAVVTLFATIVTVINLLALTIAGTMRVFEYLSLVIRGITVECVTCHRRVLHPVYECSACQAQHRTLLPGLNGVFRHVCRCQAVLPTMLLTGKLRLRSGCSHCGDALPEGGLSSPTFHVPVVAGASAGKTAFVLSALVDLRRPDDSEAEFASSRIAEIFETETPALLRGDPGGIQKSAAAELLRAAPVYVGPKGSARRRLLYLYDPAGEHLQTSDSVAGWHFLGYTKGLVLVVDPFSIPEIDRWVDSEQRRALRPSRTSPDSVLGRVSEALREQPRPAIRSIRVAVVLTKCDGLVAMRHVGHPYDELDVEGLPDSEIRLRRSGAARTWLEERAGRRNLVASLTNTFTSVGYFAVSALDVDGVKSRRSAISDRAVTGDAPRDPLLWLLDKTS